MNINEEWVALPSLPGYMCSSLGRIKRLAGNRKWNGTGYQSLPEAILKLTQARNKYMVVNIKSKVRYVHRLICEAWHPNSLNFGNDVNHIDGNKQNNIPENLEWVDRKTNINHAFSIGLIKTGEKHHAAKYPQSLIDEIRKKAKETGFKPKALKDIYFKNIPRTTISSIVNGHRRKTRNGNL